MDTITLKTPTEPILSQAEKTKLKTENALELFRCGLNCAQSVVSVFAHDLKFNREQALHATAGFGGGMGRLQDTCGAVTGAFMVIGIFNAQKVSDNSELKEQSNLMIRGFCEKFEEKHLTTYCRSLLRCDINSLTGKEFFNENNLRERVCEKCVADSIVILDEILTSEE